MRYETCPYCGTNLDPGEKCDCRDAEDAGAKAEEGNRANKNMPG